MTFSFQLQLTKTSLPITIVFVLVHKNNAVSKPQPTRARLGYSSSTVLCPVRCNDSALTLGGSPAVVHVQIALEVRTVRLILFIRP